VSDTLRRLRSTRRERFYLTFPFPEHRLSVSWATLAEFLDDIFSSSLFVNIRLVFVSLSNYSRWLSLEFRKKFFVSLSYIKKEVVNLLLRDAKSETFEPNLMRWIIAIC
jgi:hypothetical protein